MPNTTKDDNLLWLQEFYAAKIHPKFKNGLPNLQDNSSDVVYIRDRPTFLPYPGALLIQSMCDPGWWLQFAHKGTPYENNQWADVHINSELEYNDDWIKVTKDEKVFSGMCGPFYLDLLVEAFRCYVEGKPFICGNLPDLKAKYIESYTLSIWLDDYGLYYDEGTSKYYDLENVRDNSWYWDDGQNVFRNGWEGNWAFRIFAVSSGWYISIWFPDDFCLQNFQKTAITDKYGSIKFCKSEINPSTLEIYTHPMGLVNGINLFKGWVKNIWSKKIIEDLGNPNPMGLKRLQDPVYQLHLQEAASIRYLESLKASKMSSTKLGILPRIKDFFHKIHLPK